MKTLLYALGPMLFDSLGIIVFAILLVAGAGIVPATVAGTAVAVAVVGYELARGRKVAALQWISLASVLLTAAATLFTGDPRFVMAKPTIVYLISGASCCVAAGSTAISCPSSWRWWATSWIGSG